MESALEQVVESVLGIFGSIGAAARSVQDLHWLEEKALVRLTLVHDRNFDFVPTLEPCRRIEMFAVPTGMERRTAL